MTLKYETTRRYSTIEHRRHDQHHRLDGPAMLWYNGAVKYAQYNLAHRRDFPAIINSLYVVYYYRGKIYDPDI